jgi:hypothetical protein
MGEIDVRTKLRLGREARQPPTLRNPLEAPECTRQKMHLGKRF